MDAVVRLIQGSRELVLSTDTEPSVGEGQLTVHIEAQQRLVIVFDDEEQTPIWTSENRAAFLQLDLTNRVGFHRLVLRNEAESLAYDFRTDSTKATWDEIQAMAAFLAREGLAFQRQFVYSLPSGQRIAVHVPEVEYGWLRERLPQIVEFCMQIARRPGYSRRATSRLSFRGSNLALAQTLALLRSNPQLLEVAQDGPIEIDGLRYWPAAIRARSSARHTAIPEHWQIASLLRMLANACQRLEASVPPAQRTVLRAWSRDLAGLRTQGVYRDRGMAGNLVAPSAIASPLQQRDKRYGRLRTLHLDYYRAFNPAVLAEDPIRTNIRDVWEIFQAFVAHAIGRAIGLNYVSPLGDLRHRDSRDRSMTSPNIDLYYNVAPPRDVLPSWRDETDRPAGERPDIVLHDRSRDLIAIVDAKFRKERESDRARATDLTAMQSYLQSFRLARGAIAFPSNAMESIAVAGAGNELLEIPISANKTSAQLKDLIRQSIERLWCR